MAITTRLWHVSGTAPNFDLGGNSTALGSITARNSSPDGYEGAGTTYGEFSVQGSSGQIQYARSQAVIGGGNGNGGGSPDSTAPRVDNASADEYWFGCAFYLPTGFKTKMGGEVDIVRLDNYDQAQGSGSSATTATSRAVQIGIHNSDKCLFLQSLINGGTMVEHVAGITIAEGQWHWVEVFQKLSTTDGQAVNNLYLNGQLVGSSTLRNCFRTDWWASRVRVGLCDASAQTQAISLYAARVSLRDTTAGALGPASGGVTTTPPTVFYGYEQSVATHLGFDSSAVTATTGHLEAVTTPLYDNGSQAGKFTLDASAASDKFVRVEGRYASPDIAVRGDTIYSGVAVRLDTGLLTNMGGDLVLARQENYVQDSTTTEYNAVVVLRASDKKVVLRRQKVGGTTTDLVTSTTVLAEGSYYLIEWKQKLHETGGTASNELKINGASEGTSTTANIIRSDYQLSRFRLGLVAVDTANQTSALSLFNDYAYLNPTGYLGVVTPSSDPVPTLADNPYVTPLVWKAAPITVKAGIPTDADFVTTPQNGVLVLDSTNHRLYIRDGGVWKYVSLT